MRPDVRILSSTLIALLLTTSARAQAGTEDPRPERSTTVSITAQGARFAALGAVTATRLEVFGPSGEPLHNSGFLPGNVRDWKPELGAGQELGGGEYLCVVTARGVDGRVSVKQGRLLVVSGQLSLELADTEGVGDWRKDRSKPDERLAAVTEGQAGASTLTTHDGTAGQVISTFGDLTLRTGDFFAGRDEERVRFTAEGRVGIGTPEPEATLDVAGTVRARQGFAFSDGTTLSSEGGRLKVTNGKGGTVPSANVAGTGTQNQLAKWAETGGAGTLTDSAVIESGGKVGIGIGSATPAQALHVFGKSLFQNSGTASLFIVDRTDGKIAAFGAGGASATLAYDQSGIFKIESNSRATISQGVFGSATGATTRFVIDTAGNTGIGTESPQGTFEVAGPRAVGEGASASAVLRVFGGAGADSDSRSGNGGTGSEVIIEAGRGGMGGQFGQQGHGGGITVRGGDALGGNFPGTGGSINLQPGLGDLGFAGNVLLAPAGGNVRIGTTDTDADTRLHVFAPGPRSDTLPLTVLRLTAATFGTTEISMASYFISAHDAGGGNRPFAVRGDGAVFGLSFNQTSDRDQKTAFAPVDGAAVLDRLAALPLQTWRYKSEPDSVRHIGPTAQDFRAAFKVGDSDLHITTVDEGGVALAAIQALYERMLEKEKEITNLQAQVQKLESTMKQRSESAQN